MRTLRAETGSDGFFRMYCGTCGATCASAGFDRVGDAGIQMIYVCPNCGEHGVRLRPHCWENVLVSDGAIAAKVLSSA